MLSKFQQTAIQRVVSQKYKRNVVKGVTDGVVKLSNRWTSAENFENMRHREIIILLIYTSQLLKSVSMVQFIYWYISCLPKKKILLKMDIPNNIINNKVADKQNILTGKVSPFQKSK